MIKSVTIRNYLDEEVTVTLTEAEPTHGLIIESIDGLGPSKATINTSELVTGDGDIFNSARLTKRTITMSLIMTFAPDVESSRQNVYKFFPIKKPVTLFIETDKKVLKTEGYVEECVPEIFSKEEKVNLSIVCPDPYFHSGLGETVVEFFSADPKFEFPFENNSLEEALIEFGEIKVHKDRIITYDGDGEVGITMTIHCIENNVGVITIYNASTKQRMVVDTGKVETMTGSPFVESEDIIISTDPRNSHVFLLRGGEYINVMNVVARTSDWFTLRKGQNTFLYTAEYTVPEPEPEVEENDDPVPEPEVIDTSDRIQFKIEYDTIFEGV